MLLLSQVYVFDEAPNPLSVEHRILTCQGIDHFDVIAGQVRDVVLWNIIFPMTFWKCTP